VDERFDSVSSKGYAWGYVGSLIPFLVCIALIFYGSNLGIEMVLATKISFVITAAWWAAFALPLIFNVHQKHFKPKQEHMLLATFKGLARTVGNIVRDKRMLFFLLAFFCYIDGVHTIIRMATSYGTELGISSTDLIMALIMTQLVAFPSALVFGKLAGRIGTRIMLIVSVIAYTFITLYAAFFLKGPSEFWILAFAVGLFQGGVQALSRSYFGKMVPKDHANEYFGFFDIFGKYAAILGTFMMAFFTDLTGNASMGILSLSLLFILGLVFLILMPRSTADKGE
jgi:UMF1 family MFS transporter